MLWALATRRQLERWEPLVAAAVLDGFAGRQSADTDVWSAEIERHLVLVAARNLLRALELPPVSGRRGRRDAARRAHRGSEPARALGQEHAPVQRESARRGARASLGEASPNATRGVGHTASTSGATRPALASCRTSPLLRCIGCSTTSRPRSSPAIPNSAASCRRARRRHGFMRTASGGRRPTAV
jgi:hypothetical protein